MQAGDPSQGIVLTRAQAREVDRLALKELHLPGIVLMENAAIALASCAAGIIGGGGLDRVIICAGPGNNGGDGFAMARHLRNGFGDGMPLTLALSIEAERYRGDALANLRVAEAMGLHTAPAVSVIEEEIGRGTLVVDALLGTGATRAPEGAIGDVAEWINACRDRGATVLAVDVPTGLDCDTGAPIGDQAMVVRAHHTCTLCAMKPGLLVEAASEFAGGVTVGGIGVPRSLLERAAGSPA